MQREAKLPLEAIPAQLLCPFLGILRRVLEAVVVDFDCQRDRI